MVIVDSSSISKLVQRTLNRVDKRLTNHGKRVAFIVAKMLDTKGGYEKKEHQDSVILAMLHDIGAFKTEEINQLVEFETKNIWEHAVYGYLFLSYYTPLKTLAPAVLFHHLDFEQLEQMDRIDLDCKNLAQMINIADRADVFLNIQHAPKEKWDSFLEESRGTRYGSEIIDLFLKTSSKYPQVEKMKESEFQELSAELILSEEEVESYLKMLVYLIDFRSYHTVTHSITTTQISYQVALRMGMAKEEINQIYHGAMLHDLGKIGIPVEILEFPGKLSQEKMEIMKTHVAITQEILGNSVNQTVTRIALRHHEKLDGSGYPNHIEGKDLTKSERIVGVADIVSALSGTRSYKQSFPKDKIIKILDTMKKQNLIDPEIVEVVKMDFDEIMGKVQEVSAPILLQYKQMREEYLELLEKFES